MMGLPAETAEFAKAFLQHLQENASPYLEFSVDPIKAAFELSVNKR